MRQYAGLIRRQTENDYRVSFPDFPGLITAGSTLDEARAMAGEVLALKIKVLAGDDKPIPEPSPFEFNMTDSGSRAVAVILVPVTSPAPKNMSVNITLPDDVLAAIDRFAEYSGLSRSGFIENAAKKAMKFEHA
jgi:predicted RNase H-like HicB family nuclease